MVLQFFVVCFLYKVKEYIYIKGHSIFAFWRLSCYLF